MSRRLLLPFLAALLLAAPALAADGRLRPIDPRSGVVAESPTDRRIRALSSDLRCPVCQNLSVWDSPSVVARTMRARVRSLVAQGQSDAEIRTFFVARYGDWILIEPPKRGIALAVWLAPVALLGLGSVAVLLVLTRSRARLRAAEQLDPAALAAARARLEALERELPPA